MRNTKAIYHELWNYHGVMNFFQDYIMKFFLKHKSNTKLSFVCGLEIFLKLTLKQIHLENFNYN